MQPNLEPHKPARVIPIVKPADRSVLDSVRILEALVLELSERVEILETRELIARPR